MSGGGSQAASVLSIFSGNLTVTGSLPDLHSPASLEHLPRGEKDESSLKQTRIPPSSEPPRRQRRAKGESFLGGQHPPLSASLRGAPSSSALLSLLLRTAHLK